MKNAINITALSVLLFLLCSAASYSAPTTNRTTKAASASYSNTAAKTEKASAYVEGLLSHGGPSTDVFKKALGEEKTAELFRRVLFGTER